MADKKSGKGLFSAFQGVVDSVKSSVQDIKLPDVKLPDIKLPDVKLPEIKRPEVNIAKMFQKKEDKNSETEDPGDIKSISVQSAIKIIYFMMIVDGSTHEDEKQKFDEIGKELDPAFEAHKDAIISACENHMKKIIDPEDYYAVLQDGVEEAVAAGKNTDGAALAPKVLLWDLIATAYSDGTYDENERKLLKYIVRKFNIDKAVFLEMESSYLTLSDLENELRWIKTTDRPYLPIEAIVNEISDRKTAIFDSIKDLIAF